MINVTRSPINSSLTESFSGAPTIRAYNMEPQFIDDNEQRIEKHQDQNSHLKTLPTLYRNEVYCLSHKYKK